MKESPTSRSLALLREQGYRARVVEQNVRIPPRDGQKARIFKRDLWGLDIVAIKPGCPTLGVQTTTSANVGARKIKMAEIEELQILLGDGPRWKIVTHAWRKGGPRGARKVWTCTVEEMSLGTESGPSSAGGGEADDVDADPLGVPR